MLLPLSLSLSRLLLLIVGCRLSVVGRWLFVIAAFFCALLFHGNAKCSMARRWRLELDCYGLATSATGGREGSPGVATTLS